jgi:carboxypeptidase T
MVLRKAVWLPLLVAVLAVVSLVSPRSMAVTPSANPTSTVVVRLHYRDQQHLDAVAGSLDIWEVNREAKYALAAVPPAQYQWLEDLGYQVEVDAAHTAKLGLEAALDPRFYYFDDYNNNPNGRYMVDWIQETNAAYPNLTEVFDTGNAWLADHSGYARDMWVLRVTNEDPAYGAIADKPVFFLMASIHAREVATNELAMRYVRYLLGGYNGEGGYGLDPDATWLVNHNVLYVMVMQNPDGRVINEQDIGNYWRKNVDSDDGCTDPYSWGVDLNRNHSFLWGCCGGSSGQPCSETYRGPSRGSEPETAAFETFFAQVIPDQNGDNGDDEVPEAAPDDTKGIFISLHSYADEILWAWYLPGYPPAPNQAQMQVIGRKMAYYNGFTPSGTIGYNVDGSSDIWTYGKFGVPSFTFEVGSGDVCGGFFPAYGCIDGIDGMPRNFWAENKPAFLYAHKIAGEPYLSAYGPDAGSLAAVPGGITPGEPVELTATIADHRYTGDPLEPIGAAEYFVDAPGADGTGTPMEAADGSWGGQTENVEAALDTSSLGSGQHYILVHGQNTGGKWGPFSAVFLYVLEPGVSPIIEGTVRDASTNAPVAATVHAGTFQADTDPANGHYSMMVVAGTYDVTAVAEGYVTQTASDVPAQNYQTVQQDFFLYQTCNLFSDDVESGDQGWTADTPWAITEEASHSPTHSWTDSPGGLYGNNLNISLTSPAFDLTGTTGVTLSFWHIYSLQYYFDFGYVEYSTDGGATWTTAASYSDYYHNTWEQVSLALPALDNQPNARIRFRLKTNAFAPEDGWHIDDIALSGGGPACVTPMAPQPEFTSNSPVLWGQAAAFTNQTLGTPPLEYLWDLGDGVGTSTEVNPEYTYSLAGTYQVTLTATNAEGSNSITHAVEVIGRRLYLPLVVKGR